MTQEVENKLKELFDTNIKDTIKFYEVIKDYFSEDLTDLQLPVFKDFTDKLELLLLGDIISSPSDSNNLGSYDLGEDYYENNRDRGFLQSITDLGVIDYSKVLLSRMMPMSEILIKFPKVKVTNENDKSVNIDNLFVKITVRNNTIVDTFTMVRTTYDVVQWLSKYSHSHLPRLYKEEVPVWSKPCLGNGPLNSTINRLRQYYDEDVLGLFCFELAKYVTVESLAGVPYIRLETIGANSNSYIMPKDYKGAYRRLLISLKDFVKDFVKNTPIKFSYVNGNYMLGEPLIDFWIKISNSFIAWYNKLYTQREIHQGIEYLRSVGCIKTYIIAEGKVCNPQTNLTMTNIHRLNNSDMFVFKGIMQKLRIEGAAACNNNDSTLVTKELCEYILTCILKIINFKYGRSNKEEGTKVSKKCYYF